MQGNGVTISYNVIKSIFSLFDLVSGKLVYSFSGMKMSPATNLMFSYNYLVDGKSNYGNLLGYPDQ